MRSMRPRPSWSVRSVSVDEPGACGPSSRPARCSPGHEEQAGPRHVALRGPPKARTAGAGAPGRLERAEGSAGSDRIAELEQQRQALEHELDEVLKSWAVLGCARLLLERTLRRHEQERQPAVLARAGERFAKVTEGRYTCLAPSVGDEGSRDAIRVVSSSGAEIEASSLSRGSVEQLYLCLRLGLAETFAERAEALPLILDDVLVNFDPARAASVAEALADTAERHQVLFLTCHPHLSELVAHVAPRPRSWSWNGSETATASVVVRSSSCRTAAASEREHPARQRGRAFGQLADPTDLLPSQPNEHAAEVHEPKRLRPRGRGPRGASTRSTTATPSPSTERREAALVPRAEAILHLDDEASLLLVAAQRQRTLHVHEADPGAILPARRAELALVLEQVSQGLVDRPAAGAQLLGQVDAEQVLPKRRVGGIATASTAPPGTRRGASGRPGRCRPRGRSA